jgi:hypothetical protein
VSGGQKTPPLCTDHIEVIPFLNLTDVHEMC